MKAALMGTTKQEFTCLMCVGRKHTIDELERVVEVLSGTAVVLGKHINPESKASIQSLIDLAKECPYVNGEGTIEEALTGIKP